MAQERGFALAEVLVAAAILATALVTLAQLMAAAVRGTASARDSTVAMVLAAQKVEELRSSPWGVDEGGAHAGDPPAAGMEYLDVTGRVVAAAPLPPAGLVFCRRWWVQRSEASPSMILVLRVVAGRTRSEPGCEGSLPGEASLVAAKARTAR